MKRLVLLILIFLVSQDLLIAHPGHEIFDSNAIHFLLSPDHLGLATVIFILVVLFVRKNKRIAQEK